MATSESSHVETTRIPGVDTPAPVGYRPGSLVVVGSGIKSIAQFTLEAVAYIEDADKVFYCVADPATDAFIEKHSKNATDLYSLYEDDKPRNQTYTQMAEVILREVRKGFDVVACFYGHPGVFVHPSHRAAAIAVSEGHKAVILPGVSAEDCLFADLLVDPSRPGCQTLEATDLLLRDRPIATDCHVVLFQVGAVGDLGFNFKGFKNTKFPLLVEKLLATYGPSYPVVHYVASQLSTVDSRREKYKIADLKKPEVARRITGISTFYLQPKVMRAADLASAKKLGVKVLSDKPGFFGPYRDDEPYGPRELDAVKALDHHQMPKNYNKTRASPELYAALEELALKPKAVRRFKQSPAKYIARLYDLRPGEANALLKANTGLLRLAMKPSAVDVAKQFFQAALRDPQLSAKYFQILKENKQNVDGEAKVASWLKSQGYDTSLVSVGNAYEEED